MPHELATTNGRTAMMYSGDTPWHGLGTKLDEPATAAEAITKAGLNFDVALKPLQTFEGTIVPQRQAVVRTDSNAVLGVVGNSYQPVQNHQCFGFLDAIVASGELRYHTAGALGRGERIWMLAKLPGEIRIKDSEDVTEKFLLLHNSHDGTSSLRVFFTPIRVVCANTLAMAETRSRGSGVSIAHKGNLTSKIAEAQEILGFAKRFYDDAEAKINRLANFYPSRQQLEDYFYSLYPDSDDANRLRARNIRRELFRLFEYGRGQAISETKLTAWSAFNAVTEFVDHHRQTRGRSYYDRASARLKSAWFGSGAKLKGEAWKNALAMSSFN
jgi:phage/plasmid-like protein (TIGR03299 family)